MCILAGIMIAIGCVCFLRVGGPVGAVLFSVGLATIINYKFLLFTGQAGRFAKKELRLRDLTLIWVLNFVGASLMMLLLTFTPYKEEIKNGCKIIMEQRQQTGFFGSFCLAIPCGILMYAATALKEKNIIYTMLCVAAFILGGFYHCVADMFYTVCGASTWPQWVNIIFVTLGNFVGCNIIPYVSRSIQSRRMRRE